MHQRTALRLGPLIVGIGLAITVSCTPSLTDHDGVPGDLTTNRRAWQDLGYTDYSYRFRAICFCVYSREAVEVRVRGGQIREVLDLAGQPLPAVQVQYYYTIERLFDLIQDAQGRNPASLEVRYDPALHYPVLIKVDYLATAIDDELEFRASELVPSR